MPISTSTKHKYTAIRTGHGCIIRTLNVIAINRNVVTVKSLVQEPGHRNDALPPEKHERHAGNNDNDEDSKNGDRNTTAQT